MIESNPRDAGHADVSRTDVSGTEVSGTDAPGRLRDALAALPLVAILRGLHPDEAVAIAGVLVKQGFRIIEVPLNSPQPLTSIQLIVAEFGDSVLVGAGTVLNADDAIEVVGAGAQLLVAPNLNAAVGAVAQRHGLAWVPGVFTPTEAFAALDDGAAAIKLFPAESISPAAVRAMRAVLPREAVVVPVGGISVDNMQAYFEAGANGLGLGSALFRPGQTVDEVERAARQFATALVRA